MKYFSVNPFGLTRFIKQEVLSALTINQVEFKNFGICIRLAKTFQISIFSDDKKRKFQLNICGAVKAGICPEDSSFCEVSETSTTPLQSMPNVKTSLSFDKASKSVVLKYESSKLTAVFKIVCDQSTNPTFKVSL